MESRTCRNSIILPAYTSRPERVIRENREGGRLESVNYLAVLTAALSTFLIGGLWYSPLLFQRAWMKANNLTEADLNTGGQARIFGLAFVLAVVMAMNLAMFLNAPDTTTAWGATAGGLSAIWV